MDSPKRLWQAVASARRSLQLEQFVIHLQKGLLYAALSIMGIYLASRFFVLPYYSAIAVATGAILFVARLLLAFIKRPRQKEALLRLDQYYPHNELVTVLTAKQHSPLLDVLQVTAEKQLGQVLAAFKKRPKQVLQKRTVLYTGAAFSVWLLLIVFPAATQQEAKEVEADRAITQQLKKDVEKQQTKPVPEEAKKQLAELQQALEEVKTSDEALKQVVKTQKELAKLQQDLDAEMLPPDGELTAQLTALNEANKKLAEAATAAQSELSALGKPVDLNVQKSIARMNEQSPSDGNASQTSGNTGEAGTNGSNGTASSQSGQSGGNGGQSTSQTQSGQSSGNNSGQGNGQGQGTGNGNGQGAGQGQGQGSGQGAGSGGGQGSGSSSGQGGLHGGSGSGGRDLLAIPQRVGEAGGSTVDSGIQNEGETIKEKGPVPATKGQVRPYADVIGAYEESYRQSTKRLQLPQDLQQMVQTYFTSIEQ